MERVVAVGIGNADIAYPYRLLRPAGVINDQFAGRDLVAFFEAGASSALDTPSIAEGADVGAAGVFDPAVDGRKLNFSSNEGVISDDQTGSTWNIVGQATAGPLLGAQLAPIVHANHFWFAWAAFKPETAIYQTPG